MSASFDPGRHPRNPAGSPAGGKFAEKQNTDPDAGVALVDTTGGEPMGEDEFWEKYEPVESPDGSHQWEFDQLSGQDERNVWTVVEGEGGSWHVAAGIHRVNRLFHAVTANPWETGDEHAIWYESDVDGVELGAGTSLASDVAGSADFFSRVDSDSLDGSDGTDPGSFAFRDRVEALGVTLSNAGLDMDDDVNSGAVRSLVENGPYDWSDLVGVEVVGDGLTDPNVRLFDLDSGESHVEQFRGTVTPPGR